MERSNYKDKDKEQKKNNDKKFENINEKNISSKKKSKFDFDTFNILEENPFFLS